MWFPTVEIRRRPSMSLFAIAAMAMVVAPLRMETGSSASHRFHTCRDNQDFNPFEAIHQLMAGKISGQEWLNFCNEVGISGLWLLPEARATALPQQVQLFIGFRVTSAP